jgi:hypothetical protein
VACVGFFIGYSPPSSHLGPYTVTSSGPAASAQERWWHWETRAVGAARVGKEAKVVGCGSWGEVEEGSGSRDVQQPGLAPMALYSAVEQSERESRRVRMERAGEWLGSASPHPNGRRGVVVNMQESKDATRPVAPEAGGPRRRSSKSEGTTKYYSKNMPETWFLSPSNSPTGWWKTKPISLCHRATWVLSKRL